MISTSQATLLIFRLTILVHIFKSIVAIKAASEIFRILGDTAKSQQYNVRRPTFLCDRNEVDLPITECG